MAGEIVVALDFDGVVWDSVDEAFEQAWRAWTELHGPLETGKGRLCEMFRAARWQAKDGHDFYVTMKFIVQGEDVGAWSAERFRALREELTSSRDCERFVEAFYESRARMRHEASDEWMALQRPFPGVAEQLKLLRERVRGMAIATTKDAPSAERLLQTVGIEGIPVYGREVSLDKADHMRAIATRYGVGTERIVFVEDLLENLLPLRPLGIGMVLADWGYNTPAERERARAEGVVVASLERFADTVAGV